MSADREGQTEIRDRTMPTDSVNRAHRKAWLVDLVRGALSGGLVGAVIAVNVVIFGGIEQGYEASVPEVFRENALIGTLVVAIVAAGPVVGVWIARRLRRQRPPGRVHS